MGWRDPTRPRGPSLADGVLTLSVVALLMAAARPWNAARAQSASIESAVAAVRATRDALLRHREERGSWPQPVLPGGSFDALSPWIGDSIALSTRAYRVGLARWELVRIVADTVPYDPSTATQRPEQLPDDIVGVDEDGDTPESPDLPPLRPRPVTVALGAVRVRSAAPPLLAALLDTFGRSRGFVRDSTFTLVVPPGA